MRPRVTLVTSNPHKLSEVRGLLAPLGIDVRGRLRTLPEPQADDLETVVRAKLAAVPPAPGYVAVEDSGIFFRGLDGFPGVYSAYVYRTVGLEGLLRLVRGRDRRAVFRTVAGLRRGSRSWLFAGEVAGRIAPRIKGSHGFGYDPVFLPEGETRTFAELTDLEKGEHSHRGRAFRRLAKKLLELEKDR